MIKPHGADFAQISRSFQRPYRFCGEPETAQRDASVGLRAVAQLVAPQSAAADVYLPLPRARGMELHPGS